MKNITPQKVLLYAGLIAFIAISIYFQFMTVFALAVAAFCGLVIRLINGFATPPLGLFRVRHWGVGFLFAIFVAVNSILTDEASITSHSLIGVLLSVVVVLPVFSLSLRLQFWSIQKACGFTLSRGELVEMDAVATYYEDGQEKRGRIILTNQRWLFIVNDASKSIIDLTNMAEGIENVSFMGVPTKLYLRVNNAKINLPFPLLWKRQIEKNLA